jgi:glycolate oxidase FAD binding subunit
MADLTTSLQQRVQAAVEARQALCIVGGNSKSFYGNPCQGEIFSLAEHRGIVEYDPAELVITARSGTTLKEIEQALAENNQMLAFEPPHFGDNATLGGSIASGLSGNRRPYAGAARDFVLGCKIINGNGEVLSFGGQVMKNVAGYDVSRLMTGALGTLGVILEVSLKVLPVPAREVSLVQQLPVGKALIKMNELAGQPIPLSAATYYDGHLYLRLCGAEQAVEQAITQVSGEIHDDQHSFWESINEQTHRFFKPGQNLWRLSVNPGAPLTGLEKDYLLDWGGAQRWVYTDADAQTIRAAIAKQGGHASCFRRYDNDIEVFHPLTGKLKELHVNLKSAFDPHGIFNYERMYPGI